MVALLRMTERYFKWYSPSLSREFKMLVCGNDGGLPLIIFPTSFGRYPGPFLRLLRGIPRLRFAPLGMTE